MVRFSVWLVSGYAHLFVLISVVIVTLPDKERNRRDDSLTDELRCLEALSDQTRTNAVSIRCRPPTTTYE